MSGDSIEKLDKDMSANLMVDYKSSSSNKSTKPPKNQFFDFGKKLKKYHIFINKDNKKSSFNLNADLFNCGDDRRQEG